MYDVEGYWYTFLEYSCQNCFRLFPPPSEKGSTRLLYREIIFTENKLFPYRADPS